MTERLQSETIRDFGEQWTNYPDNAGYYASSALFEDVFGPLLRLSDVRDARVADIGAGTGRFVTVLLEAGARHVIAVEPSDAFAALRRNTAEHAGRIEYLHAAGDRLPRDRDLDVVFAIGVLHHVPSPDPIVTAALNALRPGGTFAIWLYGREGNAAYLVPLTALRAISRRLPHARLAALVWLLYWPTAAYMHACRVLPLPVGGYMRAVFHKFSPAARRLVLYDQLNPAYAKYYEEHEARALLERAGFGSVRLYHRHGYSWSVVGQRPAIP